MPYQGHAFPGSQPVSLDRANLRGTAPDLCWSPTAKLTFFKLFLKIFLFCSTTLEITKAPKNYWVAEKSDGTRYLMLINKEGTYLVYVFSELSFFYYYYN